MPSTCRMKEKRNAHLCGLYRMNIKLRSFFYAIPFIFIKLLWCSRNFFNLIKKKMKKLTMRLWYFSHTCIFIYTHTCLSIHGSFHFPWSIWYCCCCCYFYLSFFILVLNEIIISSRLMFIYKLLICPFEGISIKYYFVIILWYFNCCALGK